MSWWFTARFDKRRLRRELREMANQNLQLLNIWYSLYERGDVQEQELARLMLADLCEEMGRPVIGRMVREWTSCLPPKERKRRT